MPYTDYDPSVPTGAQTPANFAISSQANFFALRDMVVMGRLSGFAQTRAGGTEPRPQYIRWWDATHGYGLQLELEWSSAGAGHNIIGCTWSYTTNNFGVVTQIGSKQVNTYNAEGGYITASTVSGGQFNILLEVWSRVLKAVADLATHMGLNGTAVHGLGTMSTQNATSVAVTGGNIDGTPIGITTAALARAKAVRELSNDYGAIGNGATVTLQLDLYGHFVFTPSSTTSHSVTIAVSGVGATGNSQTCILEIINGQRSADALITWPANFKWIGGAASRPVDTSLESAGRNLFSFTTRDGGTRYEVMHLGKGG
jgi:hypothetical protein